MVVLKTAWNWTKFWKFPGIWVVFKTAWNYISSCLKLCHSVLCNNIGQWTIVYDKLYILMSWLEKCQISKGTLNVANFVFGVKLHTLKKLRQYFYSGGKYQSGLYWVLIVVFLRILGEIAI